MSTSAHLSFETIYSGLCFFFAVPVLIGIKSILRVGPLSWGGLKRSQTKAIDFVKYVVGKIPFRLREIRADNEHEFQEKFHWHVEDLGIPHAYFKRRTPQLNGKVERSHRSYQEEFYQSPIYKGDVDLD